jgi:hypothetical protein
VKFERFDAAQARKTRLVWHITELYDAVCIGSFAITCDKFRVMDLDIDAFFLKSFHCRTFPIAKCLCAGTYPEFNNAAQSFHGKA